MLSADASPEGCSRERWENSPAGEETGGGNSQFRRTGCVGQARLACDRQEDCGCTPIDDVRSVDIVAAAGKTDMSNPRHPHGCGRRGSLISGKLEEGTTLGAPQGG